MIRVHDAQGHLYEGEPAPIIDILKALGCEKGALAAFVDEEQLDLNIFLDHDATLRPITPEMEEGLEILRHSTAHLLAHAVHNLYPGAVPAIGPVIKDGFYYDIQFPEPISVEDLPKIEAEMRRIAKHKVPQVRKTATKEEAIEVFKKRGNPYKVEILEGIPAEQKDVNLYWQEDEYVDLCRGPHTPNMGCMKHFKLLNVAGAYWRGDENNIMLTRIYGTTFNTQEELDAYITRIEEAKRRDHRRIGKDLDLFSFQKEGIGFPFFHARGMRVRNTLLNFWKRLHRMNGYEEAMTPTILNRDLWIRSGHWDHYRENMYFTEIDEVPCAIKPMNCPGGILIYKDRQHSYRELPIRLGELGHVHRHEKSGALHGLMRVRAFTQDDAHHFCTPDQIKNEVKFIVGLEDYVYRHVFGFDYHIELSTRPENSIGSDELWEQAETALREVLEELNVPYVLNPGDGAFYGPKIDFHLEDCIGRTWQCGTIQLDFSLPEKFDMNYIGPDGGYHRPVMLHRTVLGSIERFMGILIEQYAGAFPFWLAPTQIKLLPVTDHHLEYAYQLRTALEDLGYRVEVDNSAEKLGKKIRTAQMEKVPFMAVIGDKEVESNTVALRDRVEGDLGAISIDDLKAKLDEQFDPQKEIFRVKV